MRTRWLFNFFWKIFNFFFSFLHRIVVLWTTNSCSNDVLVVYDCWLSIPIIRSPCLTFLCFIFSPWDTVFMVYVEHGTFAELNHCDYLITKHNMRGFTCGIRVLLLCAPVNIVIHHLPFTSNNYWIFKKSVCWWGCRTALLGQYSSVAPHLRRDIPMVSPPHKPLPAGKLIDWAQSLSWLHVHETQHARVQLTVWPTQNLFLTYFNTVPALCYSRSRCLEQRNLKCVVPKTELNVPLQHPRGLCFHFSTMHSRFVWPFKSWPLH